jgi:lysophospholipase L1-like esterase
MSKPTVQVEYYRLWEDGTWDTEFLDIPADTPENEYENAVRQVAAKIKWRDTPPVIVGLYSGPAETEAEDDLGETPV